MEYYPDSDDPIPARERPPVDQDGGTRGEAPRVDDPGDYEDDGSGVVPVGEYVPPRVPTQTETSGTVTPPPPTTTTTQTAPPPAQTGATRAQPPAVEGNMDGEGAGALQVAAVGSGEAGDIARGVAQPTITVTVTPHPPIEWRGAQRGTAQWDEGEDYEDEGSGQLPVAAWART
jgi:hypothetical protein